MKLFKANILMSLVFLVGACSQKPEPLIKEQVQSSSKEDYEYLKEIMQPYIISSTNYIGFRKIHNYVHDITF